MKKILWAACIVSGLSMPKMVAQEASATEEIIFAPAKNSFLARFEATEKQWMTNLRLSTAQQQQIDRINDAYVLEVNALEKDYAFDKAKKRRALQKLNRQRIYFVAKILTDKQRQKWQAWRSKQREKRRS